MPQPEASHIGTCPDSMDSIDESKILGHFRDPLSEMAESLMDLEDGYFKALYEGDHQNGEGPVGHFLH